MGNSRTVRCLRDLIKSRHPDFLFLSETLVDVEKVNELTTGLGFPNHYAVNRVGQGGGLAIMWKSNVFCSVMGASNNHIDVEISERNVHAWRLTCFYGYPERNRRRESWEFLRSLATNSQLPWCVFGDFNDMLFVSDKAGKNPHPQSLLNGFRAAVEDCNLVDLDLEGGRYTWEKSKGTSNWVRERIDRAFASSTWWHKFPLCRLSVTHTIVSDHDPVILELCHTFFSRKSFRFKFENVWLKEPTFHGEVSQLWHQLPAIDFIPKLISISSFMAKWGHRFFHKFRDKVRLQKKVIDELVSRTDEEGVSRYFEEKEKLNDLLIQEETYWKQRAKVFWLAEGDSNTKCFHDHASKRKRQNHISYLINDARERIDCQEDMCVFVKEYYEGVFARSNTT